MQADYQADLLDDGEREGRNHQTSKGSNDTIAGKGLVMLLGSKTHNWRKTEY